MDQSKTVFFPNSADSLGLDVDPEAEESRGCPTVTLADISKDVGHTAMAQLDALSSLVKHEASRDDHPHSGPEESLDDYMKQFMERMTGKKMEFVAPVQPVESLPTLDPIAEVRQPARAPESSESLCQMRDVANASSRSAMHEHQCRQLSRSTLNAFLSAAAASLVSTGLAVASSVTGSTWCQAASLVLLVVALALTWRCWITNRKLKRDDRQAEPLAKIAD